MLANDTPLQHIPLFTPQHIMKTTSTAFDKSGTTTFDKTSAGGSSSANLTEPTTDFTLMHASIFDDHQANDSLSTTDGIDILGAPVPNNNFVSWNTNWTGRLLNNLIFKRCLLVLIVAHSILVAFSTTKWVENNEALSQQLESARFIFLCLFSVELVLRLIRHSGKFYQSGWLFFDFSIIGASWFLRPLLILRTFRILRSLRHATRFSNLSRILKALGRAVPTVSAIACFLGILIYTFAVLLTSSFGQEFSEFRRLDVSLLTLFEIMTLDEWSTVARQVMAEYPWAWVYFVSFITMTTFIVANFVVAFLIHALLGRRQDGAADVLAGTDDDDEQEWKRLETKVEQLAGLVEAVRQRQIYGSSTTVDNSIPVMEELVGNDGVVFSALKGYEID